MRKFYFLLSVLLSFKCGFAQMQHSTVPAPWEKPGVLRSFDIEKINQLKKNDKGAPHVAHRTTAGTRYGSWFDYWNLNQTTSSLLYSWVMSPDSNIVDSTGLSSGRAAYNVFTHGLGMSFDPTDSHYYTEATGAGGGLTIPPVTDTQSYSIDSFRFPYWYTRNYTSGSGTDSMIVELFATTNSIDSGVFALIYGASSTYAAITPDSTPRFATSIYNPTECALGRSESWDSISASQKQRYAVPLYYSTFSTCYLGLSTPLRVQSGQKVVAYVHFKPADSFSLGTYLTSANYLTLFCGSTAGSTATSWPQQTPHNAATGYRGSYQTGLIAENESRYGVPRPYTFMGHNVLIPGVAFAQPYLSVPQMAFKVTYEYFLRIVGSLSVCAGSTTALTTYTIGGSWSSSTTSVATVDASTGVVYGVTPGTSTITYTLGSQTVTATVTVLSTPTTPVISGDTAMCIGRVISLTPDVTGGTWSSSRLSVATVWGAGSVRGLTSGTATLTYTIRNICGTATATSHMTVVPVPNRGVISGRDSACIGVSRTLSETVTSGVWSSSAPTVATVSSTGVVTALASGASVIKYTVANVGCTDTARFNFYSYCPTAVIDIDGKPTEGLKIYPNPTTGNFHLIFKGLDNTTVSCTISDVTGKVIRKFTTSANTDNTMEFNYPAGVYMVEAEVEGIKTTQKLEILK